MTVKLDESHGHALSLEGAEKTGYGLGRSGWVNVPLDADGVTLDLVHDWIEESYRIVAPKRLVAELDARAHVKVLATRRGGQAAELGAA